MKGPPQILAIGPAVRPGEGTVSGQRMMFQLAVDLLRERGWDVRVVDIGEHGRLSERRIKGRLSILRVVDYLKILPPVWLAGLLGKRRIVYLTTAQSLVGFLRDLLIIWPLSFRRHRIICHQFGGNYSGFFEAQSPVVRRLVRWTLDRTTSIVVEGDLVKRQFSFLSDWRRRVRSVPNGLPERGLKASDEPKRVVRGEPIRLLYLSNMIETKGYWDVLRATEILLERGRSVRCHFVGEFLITSDAVRFRDPEEARRAFFGYLETRPALRAAVTYDRRLSGEPKAVAFRSAHVFLLPSGYVTEGQPVSVLEGMAHGCVTIATDHRLIPTMVEDQETGFLVPYNDPGAIADRIEHWIDQPEELQRMSRRSVERFEERFSPERYVDRLIGVLLGRAAGHAPEREARDG